MLATSKVKSPMQDIRFPVREEMKAVDEVIVANLASDVGMVENIGHYIVDAGGKRLRPLLALLAACCCEYRGTDHIRFAAVVEFIHTATLLHDDVVDISTLRRGRPTANAEFGNAPSVLVGDFLYTRAFQLMVDIGDMGIMRNMADTTNDIAAGEVLQLARAGDPDTPESAYFDVIRRKTAVLFASACFGAAALTGREAEYAEPLQSFGLNTGMAFQIIDDVLDYEGDPEVMGKNVGDDLSEGKPTLPLIHVMQNGTGEERALVRAAILNKEAGGLSDIVRAVRRNGSLDYARELAQLYQSRALLALEQLPANASRESMRAIADLALSRNK